MQPISVGIREAKTHFSKLLKNVKRGGEIIITDHGKAVGKIVPVSKDSLSLAERLNELERNGWIEPLNQKKRKIEKLPPPIPLPKELAQRLLQEDRDS